MAQVNSSIPDCEIDAEVVLRVTVLFFASIADVVGERSRTVWLASPATITEVVGALTRDVPELVPRVPHVSFAINGQFVSLDSPIADGDEVAFIPPVSGG